MNSDKVLKLAKKAYLDEALSRPDWTKDISRDEKLLWLDKNENIDPILAKKLTSLLKDMKPFSLNTYPETAKVYKKLAEKNAMKPENFLLTNGSDGSIRVVFDVFVSPGDKVLHSSPTFAMYSVYSKMSGAEAIAYDYDNGPKGPVFNLEGFFEVIKNEKPKVVCLPNPDSPTGTIVSPEKLLELVKLTAEVGAVLLVDEAYYLFYNETLLNLVDTYPNLLVCRTFSKAWGAAGVRVGYLAGHPDIMKIIHKNRAMYEVSTFSTEFINILLDHESDVAESVQRLKDGKEYFLSELNKMNFVTTISHGNFIHVNFGEHREKIDAALKSIVLYRANFLGVKGLEGFSRFSLGTREQFETIINQIRSVL